MERSQHTMANLFAQLGKANDAMAISHFIEAHRTIPGEIQLHEAAFWNSSQACFLDAAINEDADWAGVAEDLNSALHAKS